MSNDYYLPHSVLDVLEREKMLKGDTEEDLANESSKKKMIRRVIERARRENEPRPNARPGPGGGGIGASASARKWKEQRHRDQAEQNTLSLIDSHTYPHIVEEIEGGIEGREGVDYYYEYEYENELQRQQHLKHLERENEKDKKLKVREEKGKSGGLPSPKNREISKSQSPMELLLERKKSQKKSDDGDFKWEEGEDEQLYGNED